MNKKKDLKILKFPAKSVDLERQVEAVLFSAEEPLDLESIQYRLKTKTNVLKILESLQQQFQHFQWLELLLLLPFVFLKVPHL